MKKSTLALAVFASLLSGCGGDPNFPTLVGSSSASQPAPGSTNSGLVPPTTVDRSIVTVGSGTYKTLAYGPGWTRIVRTELAPARDGRELRRVPLLCMPHFSDVHIIDEESPLRTEFLRDLRGTALPATEFQAAWRPQEALTTQVAEAMVRQMNSFARGPVTQRPFDCAVFTGDNGDNRHSCELQRFLTLMDGGTLVPSTGDPSLYEGVQDGQTPLLSQYWHPESGISDTYKTQFGFPDMPGLLLAAVAPFQATGLQTPWYTCYGNHDHLIQGNFPVRPNLSPAGALTTIAEGSRKALEMPLIYKSIGTGLGVDAFLLAFLNLFGLKLDWEFFIDQWNLSSTLNRTVTADSNRHLLSRQDFIQAHLNSGARPGPIGHGFQASNLTSGQMYYTFEPAPGILGITLDTTNPGGLNNGSVDIDQVNWMEQQIRQVSGVYYDSNGNQVVTGNPNKLVMLFSHHSIETLTNAIPDVENPTRRMLAAEFESVLHRYPNVVLWLNGHTHYCRIYQHADPSRRTGGFWEVNSPSLIDFPQQARIVELADNQDGTLSIFATLLDTAAPLHASVSNDPMDLASISRELSANDPQLVNQQGGLGFQIGDAKDRNVELLVTKPF